MKTQVHAIEAVDCLSRNGIIFYPTSLYGSLHAESMRWSSVREMIQTKQVQTDMERWFCKKW